MKTKLLLSSIVATLILSGCGGGTTNSANSVVNDTAKETKTVAGKVIDGYIKNADVYLDLNNNDKFDTNEPYTKSDENGSYKLVGNFDLNDSLTIIAKNGIDIDTNKSFDGELKTLATQQNLTPATTLVKELMDKNMTKDEAMSQVAKIMKISKADIAKDPIEKMEKENNDSLYKANLSVHKTMELIAKSDDKNVTSVYKDFADTVHKLKQENQKVDDMDDVIDNVNDINETIKEKAKDLHTQIQEMKIDKHNRADFAKEIEAKIPHRKDGNNTKFNEHINIPKFGNSNKDSNKSKDENKTFMNAGHNKYMNELNNSMDGNKSQNSLDDFKNMQKIKSKKEDKNSSKDLKSKQNIATNNDNNKSFVNKDFNKNNNHTYKENNITKTNTDKLSQTDKKDMMDDSKNKGMMNSEFNSQTQANSNSSMDAKKEANTTKYTKDNDEHSNYKSSKQKKLSAKDSNKMDIDNDGVKGNKDLSVNSDKNRTNVNNMQSNNNTINLKQAPEDANSSKNNQAETKPAKDNYNYDMSTAKDKPAQKPEDTDNSKNTQIETAPVKETQEPKAEDTNSSKNNQAETKPVSSKEQNLQFD